MSDMFCEYSGLKYKIKKRKGEYIIISRLRREGFINYIDVLGNEHSDLYMKSVKANEVDVIYNEDVFIKYNDVYFQLFADKISRNAVSDDSYIIWTDSEQLAQEYIFEKKEQFVFVKEICKEQIDSIKLIQKPIKEFAEQGVKEIIIPKEEIEDWLSSIK